MTPIGSALEVMRLLLSSVMSATVIVEVHDWLRPGTERTLRERFAASHDLERRVPAPRDGDAYPELGGLAPQERARALDEGRGGLTPWLRLLPRA